MSDDNTRPSEIRASTANRNLSVLSAAEIERTMADDLAKVAEYLLSELEREAPRDHQQILGRNQARAAISAHKRLRKSQIKDEPSSPEF